MISSRVCFLTRFYPPFHLGGDGIGVRWPAGASGRCSPRLRDRGRWPVYSSSTDRVTACLVEKNEIAPLCGFVE